MPLRLMTWNILHGGGPVRTPEIGLAILAYRPDVVVLTEFRAARGSLLRAQLRDGGFEHQRATPTPTGNGILIASRLPLAEGDAGGLSAGRWLSVTIPALGLRVHAVHVPDDWRPRAKAAAWQFLVSHARAGRGERAVYIGDFNTARHGQDSPGRFFGCEQLLGTFCSLGYADAWRHLNPGVREDSWVSPLGRGRLDAAYVSAGLLAAVQGAAYLHAEREAGLSDHSGLMVEFGVEAGPPTEAAAKGLFPAGSFTLCPCPTPPASC